MAKIKRTWDILPKGRKEKLIEEIILFFQKEREEEIGIMAAEDVLDFFLEALTKDIYNKGVEDSKIIMKQNIENLEIDLDVLLSK
jgi:uncharacterized protein (DUF2164 family)